VNFPGFFRAAGIIALVTAASAQTSIIDDVRTAIRNQDLAGAERLARASLAGGRAPAPALEALSWIARGALATGQLQTADRVALDTEAHVESVLKTRPLDADSHLPLALGAALEVQAQVLTAQGNRGDAVYLLTRALERYGATSVQARLQKNLHLLSLVGKRAIPLDTGEFLDASRAPQALSGRPHLLFFWAHWCSDCKAQGAIIKELVAEFAADGLALVAPTQRYGYVGARDVSPREERRHIATTRREFYDFLADVSVPMSADNFKNYGVSSTPTLVLVDRAGIVRLYNPGTMQTPALRAALQALVAGS